MNPRTFSTQLYGTRTTSWGSVASLPSRRASLVASDFRRVRPRGSWKPPTNYTLESESNVEPEGVFLVQDRTQGYKTVSVISGVLSEFVQENGSVRTNPNIRNSNPVLFSSYPNALTDQARAKAWSALKGQNINLAQGWAERAQTASLVESNLLRIASSLRTLRKNPLVIKDIARGANKIVKDLPNWWLETVFGWKPLVSDIYGAVTELDLRSDPGFYSVHVKGKAKSIARASGVFNHGAAPYFSQGSTYFLTADTFHGCMCRIDAAPENNALIKASALGLTNPLNIAWELTPWSFAIDWALPLGTYFQNLDAPLGWQILGMSTTGITKHSFVRSGLPDDYSWPWHNVPQYNSRWRFVTMNRTNDVVMPWEISPRFKDPFSSAQRVGTALSLLSQLLGRGRRHFF